MLRVLGVGIYPLEDKLLCMKVAKVRVSVKQFIPPS